MDRIRFFESEKSRSATFWTLNFVLLLFFIFNQVAVWSHYSNGSLSHCIVCPYSTTGMEVIWMIFPLLGTFITWPTMSEESKKLFRRYLEFALIALVCFTMIKATLRFSNPNGLSYKSIGMILEAIWLYVSYANLCIWIYQNWRKDYAKKKHGWFTPRQNCIIFYCIPALLMLITVITYRVMEFCGFDKTTVMLAITCCEAAFVLSPIKASLSWHFRP